MAEVFLFGQILGGTNFESKSLFCKWKLITGSNWKVIEGAIEGQTQIDTSCKSEFACWAHPIDIHLVTKGIQGWPRILFEVWHKDQFDRCSLISYGTVNLPSQPGLQEITCHTWKPFGSLVDKLANLFSGETLQLSDDSLVYSGEHRFNLHTETMGDVCLELNVILKDFEKFGVETH